MSARRPRLRRRPVIAAPAESFSRSTMTSLFGKIIRGEVPAEKVYETESELAFLDINPKAEGHTLVVPKLEVAAFEDLPAADLQALATTVQWVAKGIVRAMGTPHYNLMLNNGAPAGQVIYHVHFHIIPRFAGGARPSSPGRGPDTKLTEVGGRIRKALAELRSAAV